jgi:hypothetical protein
MQDFDAIKLFEVRGELMAFILRGPRFRADTSG